MKDLEYWKQRCEAAERYISVSPCDPDITEEQFRAHSEWIEIRDKHKVALKNTVAELVGTGMINLINAVQAGLPDFKGDLSGLLDIHYEDVKDSFIDLICEAIENENS